MGDRAIFSIRKTFVKLREAATKIKNAVAEDLPPKLIRRVLGLAALGIVMWLLLEFTEHCEDVKYGFIQFICIILTVG